MCKNVDNFFVLAYNLLCLRNSIGQYKRINLAVSKLLLSNEISNVLQRAATWGYKSNQFDLSKNSNQIDYAKSLIQRIIVVWNLSEEYYSPDVDKENKGVLCSV